MLCSLLISQLNVCRNDRQASAKHCLEVGCGIDRARRVILIQCRSERSRIGSCTTKFVLVVVGVVEIVVVEVLLLAPDSPRRVGKTGEQ